jgi:hypothetical protein
MKIEDLYLELGRAMTEKIQVGQDAKTKEQDLQAKINAWQQQVTGLRTDTKTKQERIQQHIDELQEAIRLASEGVDPTMAKLNAREALEDRKHAEALVKSITNNTTFNITDAYGQTYYGNTGAVPAGNPGSWYNLQPLQVYQGKGPATYTGGSSV